MLEARRLRGLETVAINVPGPVERPHVLGCPMEEAYPVIPLPGGVQIALAAMSLGDTVSFGITSDWDSTKGLRHASKGLVTTIGELSGG